MSVANSEVDDGRCHYVVPRKRRRCRMLVKKNKRFCGEHALFDEQDQDRIICPLDPKHTVARHQLQTHLANRCNNRLSEEPWIKENCNMNNSRTSDHEITQTLDERPSMDCLKRIVSIIETAYANYGTCIQDAMLTFPILQEFLAKNPNLGEERRKHLKQQSSILAHLHKNDLLKDDSSGCVIELGAGKAQLTYWLAKAIPNCRFLLVDRSGCRNKFDNKALQENSELKMERIRSSIEHLDVARVPFVSNSTYVIGVCKHFCGSATDYGINCLSNGVNNGLQLAGFALAPCCHHKSEWNQYVGQPFMQQIGIQHVDDFNAIRHVATWAVCGIKLGKPSLSNENSWTAEEKELLGQKAKVLLELGRARHLQSMGFVVSLNRYVSSDISPENLLIIGVKSNDTESS